MTNWSETHFSNIEEAHNVSESLGLIPGPIIRKGKYRFFKVLSGNILTIITIKDGTTEVLETVGTVSAALSEELGVPAAMPISRGRIPPWIRCNAEERGTFEQIHEYWVEQIANPENLEVLDLRLYRAGKFEYEYGLDSDGVMWERKLEV